MSNFDTENGRLVLHVGTHIIREYTASEIFTRDGLKPFVIITETGGGKSII